MNPRFVPTVAVSPARNPDYRALRKRDTGPGASFQLNASVQTRLELTTATGRLRSPATSVAEPNPDASCVAEAVASSGDTTRTKGHFYVKVESLFASRGAVLGAAQARHDVGAALDPDRGRGRLWRGAWSGPLLVGGWLGE